MSVSVDLQTMVPGFTWDQAVAEADRCLLCHDAPCSKGCPAGTDPATFIRQLRLRNVTGAIRTIRQNNVLGGACGVLCPAARLCERECSASGLDQPIRIGRLQRFLIEHAWKIGFNVFDNPRYRKPEPRSGRVAVVGAGPAGLSCASELAQNGYAVTLFEQREEPGGVLRYGVPSFRFDPGFLRRELDDLKPLGVEIRCATPLRGPEQLDELLKEYQAVFMAVGLWQAIPLIEGKRPRSGVFSSIRFLERFRRDDLEALTRECRGKTVAVVGGGSVAIDCAQVKSALLSHRKIHVRPRSV
ncbi:MAG: FAD-dependent oxidoreductase [Candidatus Zixiibacteriota bacterium]